MVRNPTVRGDLTAAPSPFDRTDPTRDDPADAGMTAEEGVSRAAVGARRALASPRAARQAIILRELLGPPVGMRGGVSEVPGLRP